jgi:hypothetical protein
MLLPFSVSIGCSFSHHNLRHLSIPSSPLRCSEDRRSPPRLSGRVIPCSILFCSRLWICSLRDTRCYYMYHSTRNTHTRVLYDLASLSTFWFCITITTRPLCMHVTFPHHEISFLLLQRPPARNPLHIRLTIPSAQVDRFM